MHTDRLAGPLDEEIMITVYVCMYCQEKQKAKEVVSTRSILTSSVRSTFGSLLESMSSRSLLVDSSVKSNETSVSTTLLIHYCCCLPIEDSLTHCKA